MSGSHLADLSAADLVRRTATGESSAADVVESSLERIERRNPGVNAFSVVLAEEARAEAARLDERRAAGEPVGPLHGVPVAIKEEIDVAGCVTTFGGRGNSTPAAEDGEVVRRLRQAGAIVVGKTRMPEFGQWPFTESVDGGITRNPWDRTRTPGGSSGGSAAAVALGMVPVALGGDGGGVLRPVRPQGHARPGDQPPDAAPLVGTRHDRPADPHGAGLGAGLRRDPRQLGG